MQTATDTLENLAADLINATAALADACLSPMSDALLQQLSEMLDQAKQQLTAMQEAMPKDNVVQLER
ncbi:hypothetical protein DSM110277_01639 [Sulfitobacter pontiacus]|uniref:Uncharacterized protein n=1 Tax=Sulfitobacter pontiacus TaxID=60137 RepID=A0AAX3ADE6_9RHOB|nr:hypothetical protein [Sulfitobacter pontiacus]UOA23225.1 hypothetical protein DSM110277_01639 [Sulfitobacter pontiacus]